MTATMSAATLTTLVLLGLFHGLNPAMGWLFAAALGLQERRRLAVLRALPPIALGHAASVAAVIALVAGAGAAVPPGVLRGAGAVTLVGVGVYKLATGGAHPRWVGMRVGARDLAVWSFLMSSAHGAGLMLLPALLARPAHAAAPSLGMHAAHGAHAAAMAGAHAAGAPVLVVLAVHTAAMFAAMGAAALAVYGLAGVGFLRRVWVNLDALWAGALVAAGVATFVTA